MSLDVHIQRLGTPGRAFIANMHLHVAPGQILTLMGPSGSGKSSVLAGIAGTLAQLNDAEAQPGRAPLSMQGSVHLNGQDISTWPTERRRIGLLFQEPLLFAHMSVAENLRFATPAGAEAERQANVTQALAAAGLEGFGPRDPATLSGGQKARVALMRALLAKPHALLLDEPFSKLDAALRKQFRDFVFSHLHQQGIPAILVTHDVLDVADGGLVHSLGTEFQPLK